MAKTANTSTRLQRAGTIVTAALLLALVGGVVMARAGLVRRTSAMFAAAHGSEPPALRIEWPVLPGNVTGADGHPVSWMSEHLRRELMDLVRSELNADPMDDAALRRGAEKLLATGWVAQITALRRESDGTVHLKATWRAPVALVRHGDRDHLVAAGGELLPISYPAGSVSTLRVIKGTFSGPPEEFGAAWSGGDVQAGLSLLGYLQPTEAFAQIVGVDVSKYVKSRRLVIITDQNAEVTWGAPPGEWKPGEPSTQQKLAWLIGLRRNDKFGKRIDAGRAALDLTAPAGVLTEVAAMSFEDGEAMVPGTPAEKREAEKAATLAKSKRGAQARR